MLNRAFHGKTEKVAIDQLINTLQPARCVHHCIHHTQLITEQISAIAKVSNYILMAQDNRQCVYMVLLDLSAASDQLWMDWYIDKPICIDFYYQCTNRVQASTMLCQMYSNIVKHTIYC